MTNYDFTTTLLVDQSPRQVFDAICHPQHWWSGDVEGTAKDLHDTFTYRYKDLHMSKQKVVEFIPEQKVVWLVVDSIINYVDDKSEWTGTKIIFDISKRGDKTELRFTHQGLRPEVACFDSCSNSWSRLMQLSLFTLISKGKGAQIILA